MRIKQLIVVVLVIVILYATCTVTDGFIDANRCGVDLPPCSGGLRCMNGYCKSDIPSHLPEMSDLPMMPATKY